MSILLRSAFIFTLAGASMGIWSTAAAQGIEGPRPRSSAAQGDKGVPAATESDDPYAPPPLGPPGRYSNEDVIEPINSNMVPSDSSTSNREANADGIVAPPPVAVQAPASDWMSFEEDLTGEPSFETMERRREEAEFLPEKPDMPSLLPPPESLPELSIIPAFHLGPATLALGLRYSAFYDDNILLSADGHPGDFEHSVSPRFSLSVGDAGYGDAGLGYASGNSTLKNAAAQKPNYLALNYDPQFLFFQHYAQYNAFEQQLHLNGQYVLSRTILRESLTYNHSTDPDRELQGRVSRDIVSSNTGALYQASERIAYELEAAAQIRNFEDEINSDEGRLRFWTRYAATSRWTLSVGAAGGELIPEKGTSQVFEQAWLATRNQIGTNLNVYLGVGGDFRQPQTTGEMRTTPLVVADIAYEPSTETRVDLSAIRQIFSSSDVVNQDYVSTKISVTAIQRLWQTYKVAVNVGYENAEYFQFGPLTAGPRSDNYPTARVEFSYARFNDLEAGIFYQVRKNFSSDSFSSFSNQQVGIEFRIGNLNL